ncbi:MAG: ABC transporter permease [Kiritimatiellae bacterium]|nr:ABC transporter permease [Kiritimatiellia bacterium]
MFRKLKRHKFLLEELVKRDFKHKYKGTVLGVGWSLLSPLLTLLVLKLVFTQFFGRNAPHYTTYLFAGILVFGFFSESSKGGMTALVGNSAIFTKVNVPKYIFLLSKNAQTVLNFALTLVVFFIFCHLDGIDFTWRFLMLVYPIATLALFNIGLGLVLSALYVFFRDMQYLWSVATRLIMYGSAIFYMTDRFPPKLLFAFRCNPVYDHIAFIRKIVLDNTTPEPWEFALLAGFAAAALLVGGFLYKRCNTEFLYHV